MKRYYTSLFIISYMNHYYISLYIYIYIFYDQLSTSFEYGQTLRSKLGIRKIWDFFSLNFPGISAISGVKKICRIFIKQHKYSLFERWTYGVLILKNLSNVFPLNYSFIIHESRFKNEKPGIFIKSFRYPRNFQDYKKNNHFLTNFL